jgi:hypothetical protein
VVFPVELCLRLLELNSKLAILRSSGLQYMHSTAWHSAAQHGVSVRHIACTVACTVCGDCQLAAES